MSNSRLNVTLDRFGKKEVFLFIVTINDFYFKLWNYCWIVKQLLEYIDATISLYLCIILFLGVCCILSIGVKVSPSFIEDPWLALSWQFSSWWSCFLLFAISTHLILSFKLCFRFVLSFEWCRLRFKINGTHIKY